MNIALWIIGVGVATLHAPFAQAGLKVPIVELGAVFRPTPDQDAQVHEVFDNRLRHFSRGRVGTPQVDDRPSGHSIGVHQEMKRAELEQIAGDVLEPPGRKRDTH